MLPHFSISSPPVDSCTSRDMRRWQFLSCFSSQFETPLCFSKLECKSGRCWFKFDVMEASLESICIPSQQTTAGMGEGRIRGCLCPSHWGRYCQSRNRKSSPRYESVEKSFYLCGKAHHKLQVNRCPEVPCMHAPHC